jgi:hypothetical protein
VFIDGFAGPGRYSGGEPGSPVIALQVLLAHPYFQQSRPGREPHTDTRPLRRLLHDNFRGKGWVPIEEVSDFVLEDTAYSEISHLKRATLAPMEKEGLIEAQRPGEKPRRGTFPDGTKLRFL